MLIIERHNSVEISFYIAGLQSSRDNFPRRVGQISDQNLTSRPFDRMSRDIEIRWIDQHDGSCIFSSSFQFHTAREKRIVARDDYNLCSCVAKLFRSHEGRCFYS